MVRTSLTGKQNSSKAGFTKVMYCASTCSSSLPRSLMSRRTETTQNHNTSHETHWQKWGGAMRYTVCASTQPSLRTSARESCVWIRVNKQLHLEQISDFLRVEHEDALKQDHISRIHRNKLLFPETDAMIFVNNYTIKVIRNWLNMITIPLLEHNVGCGLNCYWSVRDGCSPGMIDKVVNLDLDRLPLQDLLECLFYQLIVKGIWGKEKGNAQLGSLWAVVLLKNISSAWCRPMPTWDPTLHVW